MFSTKAASVRGAECSVGHRSAALAHIAATARENLMLLDWIRRLSEPLVTGEVRPELLAAWSGEQLRSVAALFPTLLFEHHLDPEVVEAWDPWLRKIRNGHLRSSPQSVDLVWQRIKHVSQNRGFLDREETVYGVEPKDFLAFSKTTAIQVRPAEEADLNALVESSRASLLEEGRPDPYPRSPRGFIRWVKGRLPRAWVAENDGRVVSVGYADVQQPEGWLLQGIYTWPEARRFGFAAACVSHICRTAFALGVAHLQLSVVSGNQAGEGLYGRLGFQPWFPLRTILFSDSDSGIGS